MNLSIFSIISSVITTSTSSCKTIEGFGFAVLSDCIFSKSTLSCAACWSINKISLFSVSIIIYVLSTCPITLNSPLAICLTGKSKQEEAPRAMLSCKSAIKAGDELTYAEMEYLVTLLFNTNNFGTCPHGRPIIYMMTVQEIARKFYR